ncbi:MAG: pyridoxal phosphate-dependent aminotransferase [Myxococcota bacterium]|nr:pyridoxal phosphate-dependent aminotransferase [Myxococcota bacterium]
MTQHIASRAQRLQPSPTLAVSSQAKAMRAQGHPVISLAAGEPDLATPEVVIKAAQRALEAGATRYTPVKGIPKLCAAIADDSKRARQVACDPEREVIVTVGAKQALYNAFQVLLEPGDEVLLPLPSWVSYAPQVELAGGVAVPVAGRAELGFYPSIEALEQAVSDRSRLLVLTSPSNPTGLVAQPSQVEAVCHWAVSRGLTIISDEIYRRICFRDAPALLSPQTVVGTEHVVVVDGVSKSHCMTGWRIGWAVAPSSVIGAMAKLQSHQTSNAAAVAQHAAFTALLEADDHVRQLVQSLEARRDVFVPRLRSIEGLEALWPQGAFYVFADVRQALAEGEDDLAFCQGLLREQAVAAVPGSAFGAPGWLRLSLAAPQADLDAAADRIEAYLNDRG